MKYMGSKASMLLNGLGEAITTSAQGRRRVVDLFSGSGAVAWFAAERSGLPVLAIDLQEYSAVLARAVIARSTKVDAGRIERIWITPAKRSRSAGAGWRDWSKHVRIRGNGPVHKSDVEFARALCEESERGTIWDAYGGHYFSPAQAETFDALLRHLPCREPDQSICLAALIQTASRCAASPGHTAQPFRPTPNALPHITDAWAKDPIEVVRGFVKELAPRHAVVRGEARTGNAVEEAVGLHESDLVILDPPYSAVQYSRFYHVLETFALGVVGEVSGAGRYPSLAQRPRSDFSLKSGADRALESLLSILGNVGCHVILTFPAGVASNGISGDRAEEVAAKYFSMVSAKVATRFSTLGGNNSVRPSRHYADELILTLRPS